MTTIANNNNKNNNSSNDKNGVDSSSSTYFSAAASSSPSPHRKRKASQPIFREVFEESLDILGDRGKKVLLAELEGKRISTIEETETVLRSLFGEGASLIMTRMQAILDSRKS